MEGGCPDAVTVEVRRVEAAEVDERWRFVGRKTHQRWLWHAIDHLPGVVLAYVLGSRAEKVFLELKKLLKCKNRYPIFRTCRTKSNAPQAAKHLFLQRW